MQFAKMHGTGNDFVMIDARQIERDWSKLAVAMCDRHFGIGSDGIILVSPSAKADFRMRMFNPDGSESEMCGNGIRCFAKYVIDEGLSPKRDLLRVETGAGILDLRPSASNGHVDRILVSMGKPILTPKDIPVAASGPGPLLDHPLKVGDRTIKVTCVSMGNPHAVAFLDAPVKDFPLEQVGPLVEHHPFFPKRVNFEIVNVLNRGHLVIRVWERGAGITLACGTGACAVAVAARLKGLTGDAIDEDLPGGTLKIRWDGSGPVFLEGPAQLVYKGIWQD